ncbi:MULTISPECIES: hypothetical protein [Barrientosiimonas]|uniref:Uncharacterized protein n=1 Tax=Barrientosiimonas endolithica TaxID=1535208 RepID=A0ABN6YNT2_9MICO|nr:hypothetical protein [Barrientosiimonas endolithica]BDZ57691.1 hypothetical protein GCM10025872_13480 [Barrientosiimonas endolithica]
MSRVLGIIGLTVLCVLLYAVSIDMFAGYPQVHSELLNLLGVALIILAGLVVWIRHERRDEDD